MTTPTTSGCWPRRGAGGVDLGGLGVAPDGGLWLGPVECWWEAETEESINASPRPPLTDSCASTAVGWTATPLTCASLTGDLGPDGSIWALSSTDPADDHAFDLYVITPEAVAASE